MSVEAMVDAVLRVNHPNLFEGDWRSKPSGPQTGKWSAEMEAGARQVVQAVLKEAAPLIRQAILDPGAFVPRGADYEGNAYGERLDQWQDRAIETIIEQVGGES